MLTMSTRVRTTRQDAAKVIKLEHSRLSWQDICQEVWPPALEQQAAAALVPSPQKPQQGTECSSSASQICRSEDKLFLSLGSNTMIAAQTSLHSKVKRHPQTWFCRWIQWPFHTRLQGPEQQVWSTLSYVYCSATSLRFTNYPLRLYDLVSSVLDKKEVWLLGWQVRPNHTRPLKSQEDFR